MPVLLRLSATIYHVEPLSKEKAILIKDDVVPVQVILYEEPSWSTSPPFGAVTVIAVVVEFLLLSVGVVDESSFNLQDDIKKTIAKLT